MIAYHIMVHAHPEHAARLLRWLHAPDDLFLVTCDDLAAAAAFAACSLRADNVAVTAIPPMTWGGIGMVDCVLGGMRHFLAAGQAWECYLPLSDSDIPLRSKSHIKDWLRHSFAAGRRSLLHIESRASIETVGFLTLATPHSAFTRALPVRDDVRFYAHGDAARFFQSMDASPIMDPRLRLAFDVRDANWERALYIGPMTPEQVSFRQAFFARRPPAFAKLWSLLLSRPACEWLCRSDLMVLARAVVANTFIPEETMFATILDSTEFPQRAEMAPGSIRWNAGAPASIGDGTLAELQASDALFARKVATAHAAGLLAWVEQVAAAQ